ncbi:hypothetical protein PIB30_038243 [Stylosanthes scabra]|uniref:Uncharacterized protein n=1 Tax=Stylosanthes scabra TaxID=79078 RepID=A0ABU6VFS7_9FABA|nr:hypothetical protein [Stylosanthes scabra]
MRLTWRIYPCSKDLGPLLWKMRTLGLMEGIDLPTRPIGRVWLHGLHAKHLYLGISGVYGDTSDISIHGLAPFYQILFISLVNHHSPTIATPVFLTTKIVPCVNSLGDDPSLVLGILNWFQASCDNSFVWSSPVLVRGIIYSDSPTTILKLVFKG